MAANFPNSTKTWTPLTNGTTTDVSHVNTLYDEVTAVENTLLSGTDKQILSNVNGVPTWTNASGGTIDTTTTTTLTGILKGDGANVTTATAGTDYLIPGGLFASDVNYETLTGNKNLTSTDKTYQIYNITSSTPSSVNIYLPTTNLYVGMRFIISGFNSSASSGGNKKLNIYYNTKLKTTLGCTQNGEFIYFNNTWNVINSSLFLKDLTSYGDITIGSNAITHVGNNGHIAIGYNSYSSGIVIGKNSNNYNSGGVIVGANSSLSAYSCTAVGNNTICDTTNGATAIGQGAKAKGGIAIGCVANTNTMNTAIAMGYYSKAERWNEIRFDTDYTSNTKMGHSILQWYGDTTDETETEIFLGGTTNKRATVLASSAFKFNIDVVAYDSANNMGMTFEIKGGIKRDATNNTSLIGTSTTTIISQDGTPGWTITALADDTNEALVIKVTGAAGTTIKWDCVARITELRI